MATPIKPRNELDATAQKFSHEGFQRRHVWRKKCARIARRQHQAHSQREREAAAESARLLDEHRKHMRVRYVGKRTTLRPQT